MRIIDNQISELSQASFYLNDMINDKLNFTHSVGTFTEQLYLPDKKIRYSFSDTFKSFYELNLIQAVKRECAKNAPALNINETYEINYFKYSPHIYNKMESGEIRIYTGNIIEIDISAAYFYAAKNKGLISKELFAKIIRLPKNKKLPILGAIASIKTIYHYESGLLNESLTQVIYNPELRKIWFYICSEIDFIINELSDKLKDDFIFYYVDGIYFYDRKNKSEKIINDLLNKGYICKKKLVEKIEVTCMGDFYRLLVFKPSEQKEFNFSPIKIKYIL